MKTVKKTTLILLTLCLTTISANALELLNPSDDFSGTSIDPTMWTLCASSAVTRQVNNYITGNAPHAEIRTNFAFEGDFDAQIDAAAYNSSQYHYTSYVFASFRFYTYKFFPTEESVTDSYGNDWGFAGSNYGRFYPSDSTSVYFSSIPDTSNHTKINTWFQFRIQRIDDDIYTYYRELGSQNWILQHTYLNFGTDPLMLALNIGEWMGGHAFYGYFDNFTATGFATSDPATVPEPLSILCLALSIFGLYKRNR